MKNELMEKGYNIFESLKLVFTNLNFPRLTTGLIGALFSSMGPGMIVMSAAKDGQLTESMAISWIFAIFFFAGLATMFMSLYYRTPVVIAFSIPGSVLIGKYLQSGGDIYYAVGVYFAISILVLVLTATGVIKVLIKGRPGVHLSVLCRPREVHSLAKLVLKETSSLGVRISHQSKMMAHREIVEMVTAYGKVKVKLASMAPGKPVIRVTPEYEDCRKVALAANVPINDVYLAALKEASGRYLYE